ncbi:VOC family protein [Rhizobium leguminosarum]|uniref:VOC family protein n=2 Tax=Rhizobium/Agrobacterium group TaxID=227290 RepID=UPI001C967527|nr:VOC family protein [Rhizobium leguminosarum]MBY5755087.1 VOC family protein [Rhizobium leguminosarum]
MPLNRLVIYAGNVEETARFYEKHFGFKATILPGDRIIELVAQDGGANIMLHQAAKGQRGGQSAVKLVFDVEDVEAFCRRCAENGLEFGAIHKADGYQFANAKDPCQNSISVSSRAFRKGDRGKVARVLPL